MKMPILKKTYRTRREWLQALGDLDAIVAEQGLRFEEIQPFVSLLSARRKPSWSLPKYSLVRSIVSSGDAIGEKAAKDLRESFYDQLEEQQLEKRRTGQLPAPISAYKCNDCGKFHYYMEPPDDAEFDRQVLDGSFFNHANRVTREQARRRRAKARSYRFAGTLDQITKQFMRQNA